MKILYVHGYLWQGNGSASQCLRTEIEKRGLGIEVSAPQFNIKDAKGMIVELNKMRQTYDLFVASSMGAFYSMQISGIKKILVNPALTIDMKTLQSQDWNITDEFLLNMHDLEISYFQSGVNEQTKKESLFIFGTQDNIAHNRGLFARYFGLSRIFDADMPHKMDAIGASKVCDLIEKYYLENSK